MNTIKKIIFLMLLVSAGTSTTHHLFNTLYALSTPTLQEIKYEYDQALIKLVQKILTARVERNHYQELFENGNQNAKIAIAISNNLIQRMEKEEKCLITQIKEIEAELEKRDI